MDRRAVASGLASRGVVSGACPFAAPRKSLSEEGGETRQIKAIQHPFLWNAALARHLHSPVGMIDLIGRMCVGIDAHHAATFKRAPAPIQVEPPWIGIDFDGDAVRCAGGKNFLDVDLLTGPA